MPMPRIAALSIAAIVAFGTLAAFADDIVVDPSNVLGHCASSPCGSY